MDVVINGKTIIGGQQNPSNGLWNIPFAPKSKLISSPQPPQTQKPQHHLANGSIRHAKKKSKPDDLLQGCAFSPLPSTFICAIKRGNFLSWTGRTESLITKYLPRYLATRKFHLRMQQHNLNSTKVHNSVPLTTSLDVKPAQEPQNAETNTFFALLLPTSDIHRSYSDQKGKFPVQSSQGYQYVFILYEYDSNSILAKPLKTRQALEINTTWYETHLRLRHNGFAPKIHVLDKKCSLEMKKDFKKYDVAFQLVPPYVHLRNAAERAIQTWKNHF